MQKSYYSIKENYIPLATYLASYFGPINMVSELNRFMNSSVAQEKLHWEIRMLKDEMLAMNKCFD